ncbi:MAG: hypothetical protein IJ113_06045 [Eggerthellaceae bacterium]|nr:hypothetical protein [Eggerthellaceae bacterium]
MYSVTEQLVAWLVGLGYRASTQPPKDSPDSPDEFVTVERTGGGSENLIDYPLIAIQTWAKTEPRAEEMANDIRARAILTEQPEGVHSMRVNAGPYPFYDEDTRCPRYQLVLDCTAKIV